MAKAILLKIQFNQWTTKGDLENARGSLLPSQIFVNCQVIKSHSRYSLSIDDIFINWPCTFQGLPLPSLTTSSARLHNTRDFWKATTKTKKKLRSFVLELRREAMKMKNDCWLKRTLITSSPILPANL